MELMKKMFAYLFADGEQACGPMIKWLALILILVVNCVLGAVTYDMGPVIIIGVLMILNIIFWAGSMALHSGYGVCLVDRAGYKAGWFFPAMLAIVITLFFRIGYQNERYYDEEEQKFVAVAPFNFLPYWRYQIVSLDDAPIDIDRELTIKKRLGRAQVNVFAHKDMAVSEDDMLAYAQKMDRKIVRTETVLVTIVREFWQVGVFDLASFTEPTQVGFAEKFDEALKSFFATKGIRLVGGDLVVTKVEIEPFFYYEDGGVCTRDCNH